MLRVNAGETFPITVALIDETTGSMASGEIVEYDVRYTDDSMLSPPVAGTMQESLVETGVYRTTVTINDPGAYIFYATASGFTSNTEEIIVNEENLYDLVKANKNYNISVEDVIRTTVSGTASQIARNVPLGRTDFIVTMIKSDDAVDWTSPVASGIVYAHYRSITDELPYKMEGEN